MHYGLEVVNLGDYADPREVVRLAQAAEMAGWEGLFVWDHLGFAWGAAAGDPWITLAAVAQATTRLRIGTAVTPLPRRRLQVVAQTVSTLDRLSNGRLVFGVGLGGVAQEYKAFGEESDVRHRASVLDEGLNILDRWWSGESVRHKGTHFAIDGVALTPQPLQQPRVPVWVGGDSLPAMRRAARWDGWIVGGVGDDPSILRMARSPEEMAAGLQYIRDHRDEDGPFEVALSGYSTSADGKMVAEYGHAGVTWWLESLHGYRGSIQEMLARVAAGPAL